MTRPSEIQEILNERMVANGIENVGRHLDRLNEAFERITRVLIESDIAGKIHRAGLTMKPNVALTPKPVEPIEDLTDEHIEKVAEIIGASRPVAADMLNRLRRAHDSGIAGVRYGQSWQALSKMHQKGTR